MSRVKFILIILGVACKVSIALRCYSCSGTSCQTSFEDSGSNCSSLITNPRCSVNRGEIDGTVLTFVRSCISESSCVNGCVEEKSEGVTAKICQQCCDTDLCNTGNTGMPLTPIVQLLVSGAAMALVVSTIATK
ncbi:prostate stem cell antigen-like [Ptychodera flava]|uniref:prostate stem cell antigen-like n=1 Tax=Ptychodera flava TaxID=63121 RepID=UPI00396A1A4F